MELLDDLPYLFHLIDGRKIVGIVDKRETSLTYSGHPMVLALKIPDQSNRLFVPWHAVVMYEKVR